MAETALERFKKDQQDQKESKKQNLVRFVSLIKYKNLFLKH